MSISPTLNMIIGGIQVAQLQGAAAVSILNLVYDGRELAHTHDAFVKISELRPLAQAINIRLTPNARRLQAAGAKTELAFSPFESLSLFHVIGQNIVVRQAELGFVTGRIAVDQTHDEADEKGESDDGAIAEAMADNIESFELHRLAEKLPVEDMVPEQTDDYTLALAIVQHHGWIKVQMVLMELGIHFENPLEEDDGEDLSDDEQEFAAEIQDQLTDDQQLKLVKEFCTEEDEDDELDLLIDTIINKYGVPAVHQKIVDMGFEFDSDVAALGGGDGDESPDPQEPEDDDGAFDDNEDEDEGRSAPSEYALTVMHNDLTALHHNDLMILADAISLDTAHYKTDAAVVAALMEAPSETLDAVEEHGIKLPNFEAVMRIQDEDEDREERLHRLDIQDLEILCDVLGIDRVDQEHDDLIDILCCRPQSEFNSALEVANIELPDLNYASDEPTVEDYRETFTEIAGLTMLQSAVAQSIAEGQELVLSFTH